MWRLYGLTRQEKKTPSYIPLGCSYIILDEKTVIDERISEFEYVIMDASVLACKDVVAFLQMIATHGKPESRIMIKAPATWYAKVKNFAAFIRGQEPSAYTQRNMRQFLVHGGFDLVAYKPARFLWVDIPVLSWFFNLIGKLPFIWHASSEFWLVARPAKQSQGAYKVSVIIPCKNEKGSIERAVNEVPEMGAGVELVFVEGNSTDGTYEEILRVQKAHAHRDIKVFKQEGKGKKDAVRKGFDAATGDILMILDSDLTVDPKTLPQFYGALAAGRGEFINGSRLDYPMEKQAMEWAAFFANHGIGLCLSWLFNQRVKDTLCGTKVLFARDWKRIASIHKEFHDLDPFGDFDLLFGAAYHNLKILDLPVHYKNRGYGVSQISRYRQIWYLMAMGLVGIKKFKMR